jgi:uncharacterized caspase-like protein
MGAYLRHAEGGERLSKRQHRTGTWRNAERLRGLSDKAKRLDKGWRKSKNRKAPTTAELVESIDQEYAATTKGSQADQRRGRAGEIARARRKQVKVVEQLMKEWNAGGHGYVSKKSQTGCSDSFGRTGIASNSLPSEDGVD